jgi:hypothetical protein
MRTAIWIAGALISDAIAGRTSFEMFYGREPALALWLLFVLFVWGDVYELTKKK